MIGGFLFVFGASSSDVVWIAVIRGRNLMIE